MVNVFFSDSQVSPFSHELSSDAVIAQHLRFYLFFFSSLLSNIRLSAHQFNFDKATFVIPYLNQPPIKHGMYNFYLPLTGKS